MPDILLVEDKESLRRVLRLTLEHAGYSITEAADAREAMNEIGRVPHKIVLTDLRMPNGSGLDVLRAALHRWPERGSLIVDTYGPPLAWFAGEAAAMIRVNRTEFESLVSLTDRGLSGGELLRFDQLIAFLALADEPAGRLVPDER